MARSKDAGKVKTVGFLVAIETRVSIPAKLLEDILIDAFDTRSIYYQDIEVTGMGDVDCFPDNTKNETPS